MIIRECEEPLVLVRSICHNVKIYLGKNRFGEKAYLRETVARKIAEAEKILPSGMTFIINDAWRSRKVQEEITKRFFNWFKRQHKDWTEDRIKKEVRKYVAPFKGKMVSGHLTGGATDLRLIKNDRKLPMKSSNLTYQENSQTIQPKLSKILQKNRNIMIEALSAVGLINYQREFWHWSYGDIAWAKATGVDCAIYDVIEKLP